MEKILILPAIGLIVLSLAVQLEGIAKDSSEKMVNYAKDMENAMDCALLGMPISECSPNLMETDFSGEINRTKEVLNRTKETLNLTKST